MEKSSEEILDPPSVAKPEHILVFLPLVLSLVLLITVVLKRRLKRDVWVNCWYCNQNFKVPRGNENCFDCPSCEQYNGFKEDGDYNKPIPAQYNEDLNYPITGGPPENVMAAPSWNNGLCSQCNHNQAVKIKLLAAFQPVLQVTEEEELAAYVIHLENLYRLCWRCQVQVRTTLEQQDASLAELLPEPSVKALDSVLEVPKLNKSMEKYVKYLVVLGEIICLLCSMCTFWAHSRPFLAEPISSFVLPLAPWLPSFGFSYFYDDVRCTSGILMTILTSTLDKSQKGTQNIITRLILWFILLLWSEPVLVTWTPNLTTTIFPGDRICVCSLLTIISFTTLLKSLRTKQKQHRIQKRYLRKTELKDGEINTQKSSVVADWLTACSGSRGNAKTSPSLVRSLASEILPSRLRPKCLELDHAFDQMHISLSKQYKQSPVGVHEVQHKHQTFRKCFSEGGYSSRHRPLLRPAQFFPGHVKIGQSISQSSWVAGGLWSSTIGVKSKVGATFSSSPVSSGFLTPPPSLDGSQNSQPGSMFNEGLGPSAQTVFEQCGRSWPPSHVSLRQRSSPSSSTSPESSKKNVKPQKEETKCSRKLTIRDISSCILYILPSLKRATVAISVCFNLIIVGYFIWNRSQNLQTFIKGCFKS